MSDAIIRAAGYRRVSMREQVDGHSLEAQEVNIRQYAESHQWQLVEIYTDAGISAKKGSHRPALERLMADAEAKRFDVVIVDKIDRFYRHLSGLLSALDTLNSWNVSFVSVQEQLDFTTVWGKLTLTVLGILAEIYLDNLRQETRKGKLQRARKGLWNGNIPFGYCRGNCTTCNLPNGKGYCPDFGKEDKTDNPDELVFHPIEMLIVRKIYDLYLTRQHSDASITEKLNASLLQFNGRMYQPRSRGVPGRFPPGPIQRDLVRGILINPFYTGMVPYYGHGSKKRRSHRLLPTLYQGKHPPVVTLDEFEEVQKIRALKAYVPGSPIGKSSRVYPLTGILRCGYCGSTFRGVSYTYKGKTDRFYRESAQIEHYGHCKQERLRAEYIEALVLDWLRGALNAPGLLEDFQKRSRLLAELDARLERAKTLYLEGVIDKTRFDNEQQRYEIVAQPLQESGNRTSIVLLQNIRSQLERWKELSQLEQKRLLQLALEAVYVRGNAIAAIQPTSASLPLFGWDFGNCGPDGI